MKNNKNPLKPWVFYGRCTSAGGVSESRAEKQWKVPMRLFYCRPVVYEHFKWLEGVAGCAAGVPTAAAAQLFYSRRGFNFQNEKKKRFS